MGGGDLGCRIASAPSLGASSSCTCLPCPAPSAAFAGFRRGGKSGFRLFWLPAPGVWGCFLNTFFFPKSTKIERAGGFAHESNEPWNRAQSHNNVRWWEEEGVGAVEIGKDVKQMRQYF
eukprot:TRINITY_DN10517_c0_g2_i1.p2 TRINITY_DN10517_c0_g2~~TRINITY_DN10517_c0_g2_i1.p2  ORF type:complete len:119 (-),score=0.26 TRINITY_DN10517_c0_g2_i1:65-421(-)